MDPNQTLADIFAALNGGDSHEAFAKAQDLLWWLKIGAYQPTLTTDQQRFMLCRFLESLKENNT